MVNTRKQTRKMDETITKIIDTKLAELKETLIIGIKDTIDQYFESKKKEFQEFINSTKCKSEATVNIELKESIEVLRHHVAALKSEKEILSKRVEDLDQYGRRTNLRIFGVPTQKDETAQDV